MGRPVILGNGSLTVGLNEFGLVHDFYYPYVGLDNLTTARSMDHRIGVWVDGAFSWIDDGNWTVTVDFEKDALVSNVRMESEKFGLHLTFSDFIDNNMNAFCRHIKIQNAGDKPRSVRLFMHQVFQISRGGRGDTALYVPEENYLLDYKGRCSLLIYAEDANGNGFDRYAVGNYGIENKEGTYRDAEDGELSGNPVEHGGVDTVLGLSLQLPVGEETYINYWIVAADSQFSAEKLHHQILSDGMLERLKQTRHSWYTWLDTARDSLQNMSETERTAVKKSLMIIKSHTDRRGGIIASCDSSIYNYGRDYYSYVWPRDGAYAMWPLIRLGYREEPRKFFEFCRDILTEGGYLMHKYQPDRAIGSTWHPLIHGRHAELAIQEDETAIVLFMLGEYLAYSQDRDFVISLYITFIQPAANFMAAFRDESTKLPHASYDLWEEKFATHTYTVALVHNALLAAAEFAELFEYPDDALKWREAAAEIADNMHVLFDDKRKAFRKSVLLQDNGSLEFDNTLDVSSLYGAFMFALDETGLEHIQQTAAQVESELLGSAPIGGSPRYEHDQYFASDPPCMGNPWFVTTLWLAQYYNKTNNSTKTAELVAWTLEHALPSGVLSEQIEPQNGTALSVAPLVWSHAELINTLLDIHS